MKYSKRKRYGVVNIVGLDRANASVQEAREGQNYIRIKRCRKKALHRVTLRHNPCPVAALPVIPIPDFTPPQPSPRKPKRATQRKQKHCR